MRRDNRHDDLRDARRKCNSFENDRVAYRARVRGALVCFGNDQIGCLKNRVDVPCDVARDIARDVARDVVSVFKSRWCILHSNPLVPVDPYVFLPQILIENYSFDRFSVNLFNPRDVPKHHFTAPKTDLIFYN